MIAANKLLPFHSNLPREKFSCYYIILTVITARTVDQIDDVETCVEGLINPKGSSITASQTTSAKLIPIVRIGQG